MSTVFPLHIDPRSCDLDPIGRVHSVETFGTVDGPGIRYVLFLQGCPLRCAYCHNPDCQDPKQGRERRASEVVADIQRYRAFLRGGGVTITGGEPLLQPGFVRDVFRRCRELGIHTTLDTSGFCPLAKAEPVLEFTDLVLLDIKSFRPQTFREVTGVDVRPTLKMAKALSERGCPMWIRYVLVPGLTDNLEEIDELAEWVAELDTVQRLEVLPFHKMGELKWKKLGMKYRLADTEPPTPELVQQVEAIFRDHDLPVVAARSHPMPTR